MATNGIGLNVNHISTQPRRDIGLIARQGLNEGANLRFGSKAVQNLPGMTQKFSFNIPKNWLPKEEMTAKKPDYSAMVSGFREIGKSVSSTFEDLGRIQDEAAIIERNDIELMSLAANASSDEHYRHYQASIRATSASLFMS